MNFKLFRGASIQIQDLSKAEYVAAEVAKLPAVKQIWPVKLYQIPKYTVHSTGSPDNNDHGDRGSASIKRAAAANDTVAPHLMTQVNMLKDSGVTGAGIKIGVIDTGVSEPTDLSREFR